MAKNYNEVLNSGGFLCSPDKEGKLSGGHGGFRLSGEPFGRIYGPTLRDFLRMAPMGRPGACAYEDILLTALTPLNGLPGANMSTLWGIEDSAALEYVLCQGKRVLACAYRHPLTREKAAFLMGPDGLPPELPVIDMPSHAKCAQELEEAYRVSGAFILDTCSLSEALRAIGLKEEARLSISEQWELLRSRHMLTLCSGETDPDKCRVSRFGRQCGLLMRCSLGPGGGVRREVRVLLPAMDAFCQGVEYPRSRVMRIDDGGSLSQRLRRAESRVPSFYQYQRDMVPGAVERLREAITAPLALDWENAGFFYRFREGLSGRRVSFLEGVSQLGCDAETYEEFRGDENYSKAVKALAKGLERQEALSRPGGKVLPLSQRLQGSAGYASPLGELTLAEYFQGLAILGRSSFVFWLFEHSLLPRTLKTLHLHMGSTLGELYQAASKYYTEWYQNDIWYSLLVLPLAAIAPDPERVPRLRKAA